MVGDADRTGEVVGGWRLEARLGAGGMGSVYRATSEGRAAAVKILSGALSADPDAERRFRREVELLQRLDHPAIVRIYEHGIDHGVFWFAMELVDGPDLRTRLANGPLVFEEARAVFSRLFDGLEHAHAQGIVHRDLKPANVLLAESGAKLADFGIAHADPESAVRLTETAAVLGTFAYMSPEQRAGAAVDRRSDLFSAGVMLYEALTGALPQGAFAPPSRLVRGVSAEADELVSRLLQPRAEARFATAAEAARALRTTRPVNAIMRWGTRMAAAIACVVIASFATSRGSRSSPGAWESTGGPGEPGGALGVSSLLPAASGVLYAATSDGVFKRAASCTPGSGPGSTWCRIADGLRSLSTTALLDAGATILVATNGAEMGKGGPGEHGTGVYEMDPHDERWKPLGTGGPPDAIALSSAAAYVAADGNYCRGVFRLSAAGEWVDVSDGLDPDRSVKERRDRCINALVFDGAYLYAGSGVTGVHRSSRYESGWTPSWSPLPAGLPDTNVVSLHRPLAGGPLLVGTTHCGLWAWNDGWSSTGSPFKMVRSIAERSDGVFIGGGDRRVAFSPDLHAWYEFGDGLPFAHDARQTDPTAIGPALADDTCYVALAGVVYQRSCTNADLSRLVRTRPRLEPLTNPDCSALR